MQFATNYNEFDIDFDFLALSQGAPGRMGMQGDPGISGYEVSAKTSANTSHDHISTLTIIHSHISALIYQLKSASA